MRLGPSYLISFNKCALEGFCSFLARGVITERHNGNVSDLEVTPCPESEIIRILFQIKPLGLILENTTSNCCYVLPCASMVQTPFSPSYNKLRNLLWVTQPNICVMVFFSFFLFCLRLAKVQVGFQDLTNCTWK